MSGAIREDGFYWVRRDGSATIARYRADWAGDGTWYFAGNDTPYDEEEMAGYEVGPRVAPPEIWPDKPRRRI